MTKKTKKTHYQGPDCSVTEAGTTERISATEAREELKKSSFIYPPITPNPNGKKETQDKLTYELYRPFITAMASRMSENKDKYPPYNRKKPMDIESLKQALFRHTIQVMDSNYSDGDELGHISAIALNAMFIYYQLHNDTKKS